MIESFRHFSADFGNSDYVGSKFSRIGKKMVKVVFFKLGAGIVSCSSSHGKVQCDWFDIQTQNKRHNNRNCDLDRKSCYNTGINTCSFLCWARCIVARKVSTKSLMEASSDCFPSLSCLLLREYWNLLTNNNNIRVKETKIWLPFKTWCALSVPRCASYHKRN